MKVFVLDRNKKPLMPMSAARARKLLKSGRAVVARRQPFAIRLKDVDASDCDFQPMRLKFDPGSRTTGIAILREDSGDSATVLHLAELEHRTVIKKNLDDRRARRRRRRTANLRYRPPRFDNRTKPKGWLPPSLISRVDNIEHWTRVYISLAPISAISDENVRFDTQKMQNPEVSGVEYQQGEMAGYEVREYLLEKWGRKCAYCGAENTPLEVEHIRARSKGGSNRVSNLTLSCVPCNQKKGNRSIEEFLENKPDLLAKIKRQIKNPLRDAAMVTATRWAIFNMLKSFGLAVESGTGGRTKFNRTRLGIPKGHALDAACVGASTPDVLHFGTDAVLVIKAVGRGKYQRANSDAYGFPKGVHCKGRVAQWRKSDGSPVGHSERLKLRYGMKSNDYVRCVVPTTARTKYAGVRASGYAVVKAKSIRLKVDDGDDITLSPRYFQIVDRAAGYTFRMRLAKP